MRIKTIMVGLAVVFLASAAFADLEPWKDYDVSDSVFLVTAVQVDANMDDAYLEGIKQTWAASNDVAKELGQIVDYRIFRSDLPQSGDFNAEFDRDELARMMSAEDIVKAEEMAQAWLTDFKANQEQ